MGAEDIGMTGLPSADASRAVLIGASEFDKLDDLPAVAANVEVFSALIKGALWGLPPDHCFEVLNPTHSGRASKAIRAAAEEATDALLVYYSGHGLLDSGGQLYLAVPESDHASVYDTAIPYEWVRRAVERSRAARKIVILDCCYSARAFGPQSAQVVDLAEVEGTFVLAAAAETAVALAPPGDPFTAFTQEMLDVLKGGVPGAPELLTLDDIFSAVRSGLAARGRPQPQSLCRNKMGDFPFARNAAYRPEIVTPRDSLGGLFETLHEAGGLADTLQAVADGVVRGLGYDLAAVNLVRPDGDLVVAAFAGSATGEATLAGRVGSRASWERRLAMGERWGSLRFISHTEGWVLIDDDVPQWHHERPLPLFADEWHPGDRLYAPMYSSQTRGRELIGVISVDGPRDGRYPGVPERENLQSYAAQAAFAIGNVRLRGNMQRAMVRLERDQQALRASEEGFRQAFEYAPTGIAIAEMGEDRHRGLLRVNDALCRLLGRSASTMRRFSFADLVHPEDVGLLLVTSAEGGRAELRLARRDGSYVWVSLRNSVVVDTADGPRFLLTYVEDIEERKSREIQLAHRASHDSLTGLPNSTELRARLSARLCSQPQDKSAAELKRAVPDEYGISLGYEPEEVAGSLKADSHAHAVPPDETQEEPSSKGLAVLFCDLDGFESINERFGHHTGDSVLIEVARRLTGVVRDGDTVARLGGDEFVVLADALTHADAADLAARLRNATIPPIRVDGRVFRVGASIGIGWADCHLTAEGVLHSADRRMYVEKRSRSTSRSTPRLSRRSAGHPLS